MRPMGLGLTVTAFILVLGVHPVENRGRISQPTVSPTHSLEPVRDAPHVSSGGLPDSLRPFWHRNAPQEQDGLLEAPKAPHRIPPRLIAVTATAYSCERSQTDSTPDVTASGRPCGHPHLAVSRDLLRSLPFGTRVFVGDQEFIVADTMHRRWRNRIDLPFPSRGAAIRFGVREMKLEMMK